ncbi:phosphoribosylformylglycinamidine synthase subunit PurL [Alphaproteobacteria bacterium]|jgi:phosphoribosylformylglycinamidine synthase subunit PurL|nr:phosphoribosylformylglycinamidine synthase subunit PurL [Alphaproteobacteria bacterium]MDC0394810.1 phosphoribosylformylglycinamidine synthase subunit PurL [Alphaproteobacteria bacterium]MDC0461482.1 phosphoribosylformylglycinamidine synthase subunit PurL [Alphaproteobacteria bacterium]
MSVQSEMQFENAAAMGLSKEEWERVCAHLGRIPNLCELGIFSAMWSEHCSYKSSKKWLKTLPTDGAQVIQGPGENAGVVDIGDGTAVVFKIESHNHPSFIEPYQGAATGVGGILRDVFTMGARPVALLNALRFGQIDHEKTPHLVSGVTAGIGGYGNCIGIPTVGGEVEFDASYNGNILVNAMAVGIAHSDRIFYSAASGAGNPVIYVGAKTGRDGIHGATMASAEFSDETESKRPTVQVGDPFTGKLLMEACLELMAADAVVAIQDMGAAGLTSSSVEMAAKGGLGMEIDLDLVPVRESEMSAYEIMLSESQERMLMVIDPSQAEIARQIFNKWDLDFMPIGQVTDSDRLILLKEGEIACDIPLAPLVDDAPEYDRPHLKPELLHVIPAAEIRQNIQISDALKKLIGSEDLCSRRWIYEQYDSHVMADTIIGPGGDAALVRVHGTNKALALTVDCTPRYVEADPYTGGKQAVAEAYRNIICVGATPLAVTNNLNFGNPEKPEIMTQLVQSVTGMKDACTQLSTPVVSGNVSLYNETDGKAIKPCPVIGMVGVIEDWQTALGIAIPPETELFIVGQDENINTGWLSNTVYAKIIAGRIDAENQGAPPPVDLMSELQTGQLILDCYKNQLINAVHDISDGGMLVALCEMMLAGNIGAEITLPDNIDTHAWCFGENQSSYIIATSKADEFTKNAAQANIPYLRIGRSISQQELKISNGDIISLKELKQCYDTGLSNRL